MMKENWLELTSITLVFHCDNTRTRLQGKCTKRVILSTVYFAARDYVSFYLNLSKVDYSSLH